MQALKNNIVVMRFHKGELKNQQTMQVMNLRVGIQGVLEPEEELQQNKKQIQPMVCVLTLQKGSPLQLVYSSEQFWSVCTKDLFTICAVTSTEEHRKFLLHGQQEFIFFLSFYWVKRRFFFP